jgi:hypothetical protein
MAHIDTYEHGLCGVDDLRELEVKEISLNF